METETIAIIFILIALFFILRPLFIWYWKIDEIRDDQKAIRNILEIVNKDKLASVENSFKEERDAKIANKIADIEFDFPSYLPFAEIEEIKRRSYFLKEGELLILNKITVGLELWEKELFEKIENKDKYFVVARLKSDINVTA
jgi:hypothetical protein